MLFVIALLFLASVVYVDLRSRRGWGLALVSLALASYSVWLVYAVIEIFILSPSGADNLAAAYVIAVYFGIYLALTPVVWLVALVEAGISRQWRWFVGLIMAALIPGLLILAIVKLKFGVGIPGLNFFGFGLGLIPAFIILAYAIARIVRPVPLRAV